LIIQQFNVSAKGIIDATNTLVKEAQVVLRNIVRWDAFITKGQWSVIWMKEEHHAKFSAIYKSYINEKG
jgi:hypothetical protein